ncbi:MAG: prepilin-type N-terminal cleavage/methylation domain-containing protein [Akkermansiaceae bacterium]|jgi:prepilin-type N-terminal cleavage/methylation domain-containing protein/prepilin-type processing-associated H-X9-DG protein|nr:prepilin-type N-terminal cleavage/methylation domain-containing protein [Akkermansiaceae bacterium]MDP4721584.1 prepilin-type N-terminal cleavage/methylation domain-containing protein [Akkermansiaceae bacterium]
MIGFPKTRHTSPLRPSGKAHGFTLLELLVVIVIVAVLASLVFVGARKGMSAAHASTCVSNLKQIGTAIHMIREDGVPYSGTGPGMFPGYAGQIAEPGNWREFSIYALIGEQQGYCRLGQGKYEWSTLPSETILQNPLSEHKFADQAKTAGDVTHKMFSSSHGSFCYNAMIEGWIAPHTVASGKAKLTRMSGVNNNGQEITDPSLTIMMGESSDTGGGQVFTGWTGVAPNGNYKEGAHCVFVDGHVALIKNDLLKTEAGKKKYMDPNGKR